MVGHGDRLPCKIVPFGLSIIPAAKLLLLFESSSPKIVKFWTEEILDITPSPNFELEESLNTKLFKCSVILILYLIPRLSF